jgi:uncharacterized protein (DUF1810 family)
MGIDRFRPVVQRDVDAAVASLETGVKSGHWMWWMFPQAAGLGVSEVSELYGLCSFDEAVAYLGDPDLRSSFERVVGAVWANSVDGDVLVEDMFPYPDALKMVSSLTLMLRVVEGSVFEKEGWSVALKWKIRLILFASALQGLPSCAYSEEFE